MARSAVRSRVAAHLAQFRARGLRPIQSWVPDTRAPGFAEEARRQSLLVASESDFDDMMDFIERNEPEPDDVNGRDADASR